MICETRVPCRWRGEPFEIWVDRPDRAFIHHVGDRAEVGTWPGMSLRHRYGWVPRAELTYVGVDSVFAGALLRLDDAFASVASPASIAACPCCPEPADYAALLRTPRHQLTGIELGSFAFRVMNTVCSAAELRYFAGRILQLVHGGDQRMPDMEVVYGKLRRADWQSWAQAAALAEVFDALWDSMFAAAAPRTGVDTVLCALGAAEPSIAGRLVAWERLDSARSIRNLHEFVVRGCRRRGGGLVPRNSYWDRRWATYGELVAWLGRLPAAVNSAFDRVDDAESLELLAATHDVLEGARPSAAE